jgi:hypothetical protein
MENFRKTRRNLIIISGLGARNIDRYENLGTISSISRICRMVETHKKNDMEKSNWHQRSLRYAFSPRNNPLEQIFAIISAVKRQATLISHTNVRYFVIGYRSNVLGVFKQTEKSETSAQKRINLRTHS